jgi:hypothetical protein
VNGPIDRNRRSTVSKRVALAAVVCGLALGWSCQPERDLPDIEVEAARGVDLGAELPAPFAALLEDGNAEAALQGLESLWDEGSDPRTIEAIRARALGLIEKAGEFEVGDETFALADMRYLYEWQLEKPDLLIRRLPVEGDLAPERLLFLAVAVGAEHDEPAGEKSSYVSPVIDIPSSIENADPWVVSAALFMARKQEVEIDPDDLMERWQSPLPWDETCTEQALLYLAALPEAELATLTNPPPEFATAETVDPEYIEIQPWLFLSSGEWQSDITLIDRRSGLVLEVLDSTMDPINERSLDADDPTLKLPATRNYYVLRYLDGAMHGESRFVEGTKGTFVRMAVAVEGGV